MPEEKQYLFDKPRNVKIFLYTLYISCGILFLLDFIVHRHVVHHWEELIGFYPIFGVAVCAIVVLASKVLRFFVQRDEDYYERNNHGDSDVVS